METKSGSQIIELEELDKQTIDQEWAGDTFG